MPVIRPLARTSAALVTLLVGHAANALPTRDAAKDECINANEAAQGLRAAGKLRDAEAKLAVCTAEACPGPVRDDCAERLNEVQRALPTVAFDVRGADGMALSAVRVSMDGVVLTSLLDGNAVAVDPGRHTFSVTAAGFTTFEETLLILEGEKARLERFVLQPAVVVVGGASTDRRVAPLRIATFASLGVGVAGVAVGAVFGALALGNKIALDDHCSAGACPPSEQADIHGLHTNAVGSNVGIGVGAVGLAAFAVLSFVSLASRSRSHSGETARAPRAWIGLGGAGLGGTFP